MAEMAPDADWLRGKRIAFTGRLATMTRKEVASLVATFGGKIVPTVGPRTAFVVIGQDGWPLQDDGRLSYKLRKARSLQRAGHSVTILAEEELLTRLGLHSPADGIRRLFTTIQLARVLNLPASRIRRWVQAALIRPVETMQGISYFDYQQVVSAKTLHELTAAGVDPKRIRTSMRQLRNWLDDVDQPLQQLSILERDGKLLVRLDGGLVEPTGQRTFDFSSAHQESLLNVETGRADAGKWFELGCKHEDSGNLQQSADAYRQALLVGGPNAEIVFNLANVLHGLDQREEAVERYYQAVELDQAFVAAWNNLGVVLQELQRIPEALSAFEKALALSPEYADARFNLADLLEEIGRESDARPHWKAYLRNDRQTPWARYARTRLCK